MYSSNVQIKQPRPQQATVDPRAKGVMLAIIRAEKGANGATAKGGRTRENPTAERKKRLKAIGSQMSGTTYQLVRVKILKNELVRRNEKQEQHFSAKIGSHFKVARAK